MSNPNDLLPVTGRVLTARQRKRMRDLSAAESRLAKLQADGSLCYGCADTLAAVKLNLARLEG